MGRAFHISFERQHARWGKPPVPGRAQRVEEIWEYQSGAIHDRADHGRSKLLVLISQGLWRYCRPEGGVRPRKPGNETRQNRVDDRPRTLGAADEAEAT